MGQKTAFELANLFMEVRRPYLFPDTGRDATMDRWRDLRHRRLEPWTPSNFGLDKANLKFKDLTPEFVVSKLKSRLGANEFKYNVKVPGDAGPKLQRQGEKIEDFVRGSWDMLDPNGAKDIRSREHLAADGKSWLEFEYLPKFRPPQRRGESDEDYEEIVERFREEDGLGLRLLAPDPRSIYTPTGDVLDIVFKVVNRPLIDVYMNWATTAGVLKAVADSKTGHAVLSQTPFLAGEMAPSLSPTDYGQMCRIVRATDADYIYDLAYIQLSPTGPNSSWAFGDNPGEVPQLLMLGAYKNPFGRVPFFEASARRTADPDPAYRDKPLAFELIEMAGYINQHETTRSLRGTMEALTPIHYQPHPDDVTPANGNENATPQHIPMQWRPGFMRARGEFKQIPMAAIPDFEKHGQELRDMQNGFHQGLSQMLQSGQLGRASAAWMALQANEEVISFLQEAVDSRANQRREASEALLRFCEERAEDGPITVRVARRSRQSPTTNIDVIHKMEASDFKVPYRLEVTLDAMTQSQRAARVEYGRRLYEEESISEETYLTEYVGLEDLLQEQARKDKEKLMKPMREAAVYIGLQKASNDWYALVGDPILPVLRATQMPDPTNQPAQPQLGAGSQTDPAGGSSQLRGSMARGPSSPGQGQPITQPQPSNAGDKALGNNGAQGAA